MSKFWEKESLECGRMDIWALKTQKLPGPLSGIPATFSLRSWARPDQILDLHLLSDFNSTSIYRNSFEMHSTALSSCNNSELLWCSQFLESKCLFIVLWKKRDIDTMSSMQGRKPKVFIFKRLCVAVNLPDSSSNKKWYFFVTTLHQACNSTPRKIWKNKAFTGRW